jgi:HD superfamily phosphohydrolase
MVDLPVTKAAFEIRDPIHGPIGVSPEEIQVVDNPYVQRLRGIKQTGFAELAFPGATQTRYSHSLGAFHLAGRAFDHVFHDFPFEDTAERQKFRNLLRMAALLHDSGHGPLSHAIEQAMPPKAEVIGGEGQASHEDYTELIVLRSSLTETLKKLYGEEAPLAIASLIRNENRKPDIFKARRGAYNIFPILSALISGELDVDRMDYLVRDSLYCGIPYGNFDRDWILSNLTYYEKDSDVFLALDSRATYAFEDFLLSRYHMFVQVYLHHKSVIYDEMLYQFLLTDDSQTRLPSKIEEYLEVDDHWLGVRLRQSKNPWAQRIVQQKPYKLMLEVRADMTQQAKVYADELEAKLKAARIPYFRSSSTGLLSKYANQEDAPKNPLFIKYRDPRFTSSLRPGSNVELASEAVELFSRYKKKRIIDRIYAERSLV